MVIFILKLNTIFRFFFERNFQLKQLFIIISAFKNQLRCSRCFKSIHMPLYKSPIGDLYNNYCLFINSKTSVYRLLLPLKYWVIIPTCFLSIFIGLIS